ncbi:hypothetical protein GGG16DRAFT_118981 [Schizophyllum commune]|nr:hypothetical protein K525DRAFT_273876 [Schizophyllum commune Loenen D]
MARRRFPPAAAAAAVVVAAAAAAATAHLAAAFACDAAAYRYAQRFLYLSTPVKDAENSSGPLFFAAAAAPVPAAFVDRDAAAHISADTSSTSTLPAGLDAAFKIVQDRSFSPPPMPPHPAPLPPPLPPPRLRSQHRCGLYIAPTLLDLHARLQMPRKPLFSPPPPRRRFTAAAALVYDAALAAACDIRLPSHLPQHELAARYLCSTTSTI